MDSVLITNVRLGESGTSSILIEKDRISECSSTASVSDAATLLDGGESRLLPGFIDVHIHGAIGHDVNASTAEELLEVAEFLAGNGVTSWLPTLVPDSDEN